ncbi:MAG TPA: SDR family NAD(P)-dependent oxidoreductase [Rudaea sp.]|nr:SDR family NAD(P)-dependent oxidoreductase [Rudaea sp.]
MVKSRIARRETALITGASSGIGEALAECFAQGGFDLVLVARSADKLAALAKRLAAAHKVKATVAPADLSRPGSARTLAAKMRRARRAIDVLVNCAGVLEHGAFVARPAARHQEQIDLNVSALTAMLAHFVPPMVARGHGRILNVASIAAFQPVPSLATYAATKAYVLSLTESLSEELDGAGVTVTALCPGITATHMLTAATAASPVLAKLPGFAISDVEAVAKSGYQACMNGDVIDVPGVLNQAAILAGRVAPKWLLRSITGAIGRTSI